MQTAKLVNLILLFSLFNIFHFGQSKPDEKIFRIAHLKSISFPSDIKKEDFFDQISNWILGEQGLGLIKPTNLVVNKHGIVTVLDQGLFNIVGLNLNSGEFEASNISFPSLVDICNYENDCRLFTD